MSKIRRRTNEKMEITENEVLTTLCTVVMRRSEIIRGNNFSDSISIKNLCFEILDQVLIFRKEPSETSKVKLSTSSIQGV